jgi:hypothetical protein
LNDDIEPPQSSLVVEEVGIDIKAEGEVVTKSLSPPPAPAPAPVVQEDIVHKELGPFYDIVRDYEPNTIFVITR